MLFRSQSTDTSSGPSGATSAASCTGFGPRGDEDEQFVLSFIEFFIFFLLRDARIPFLVYDKLTLSSMHITPTTREFDFVLQ